MMAAYDSGIGGWVGLGGGRVVGVEVSGGGRLSSDWVALGSDWDVEMCSVVDGKVGWLMGMVLWLLVVGEMGSSVMGENRGEDG